MVRGDVFQIADGANCLLHAVYLGLGLGSRIDLHFIRRHKHG